jgi:hypothetical protein
MARSFAVLGGVLVTAALVAASSAARVQAPSGDACAQSGAGPSYRLVITIPVGAVQQYGFDIGTPGTTAVNAVIAGTPGSFSSQGLPAGTTGAWLTQTPIASSTTETPAGISVTLTVGTAAAATGPLTIVPLSAPAAPGAAQSAMLDAVTCVAQTTRTASNSFTVARHASYDAKLGAWYLTVTIPGPGLVSAGEPEPTTGTSSSKSHTAKSEVHVSSISLKSAGKVTLVLRPTPTGLSKLEKSPLKVRLSVTFRPTGAKAASKLLTLTLEK